MTSNTGKSAQGIFTIVAAGIDVAGRLAPDHQQDAVVIEFKDSRKTMRYTFASFASFLAALDFQTEQTQRAKARSAAQPVPRPGPEAGTLTFSIKAADVIVKAADQDATAAIVVEYQNRAWLRYECATLAGFFHAIDYARTYAVGGQS